MKFKLPVIGEMRFNPVVSLFAIIAIWGFVAVCMIEKENVPFSQWKEWIVRNFTWLYIGSTDIWVVFALVLYFRFVNDRIF